MAYVAPVHRPSSIRHAVRARFRSPDQEDLIFGKTNRLEIWQVSNDGMACVYTTLIYGTITMLQRMRPKDADVDVLFVGTDRQQYFNVRWNSELKNLDTVPSTIKDVSEPYMRMSQSHNKCLVDPTGRFMAMHLWEGVLNLFRLSDRKGITSSLYRLDQVRLAELWMKASTFLHSRTGHPRIAFLYKTQLDKEEARIAVYRFTKDDKGTDASDFDPLKDRELDQVMTDPFANMLIPVPILEEKRYHVRHSEGARAHVGGFLVVGETLLTYFDSLTYSSVSSVLKEPKIFVAYADYDGIRFFLADDYGRMDILTIETAVDATGVVVSGMARSPVTFGGAPLLTSRASTLVYMGNEMLFLASNQGDSQLFHVDINAGSMSLVRNLSNNAPILDFAIMDMGNREGDSQFGNAFSSGQTRIVAGCGAYRDGTLRNIRSGVGLEDEGILDEFQGTRGIFTLRSFGAGAVDIIVLSLIAETRVLRFDACGGIQELPSFQGLALNTETLLAANVSNGQMLQITPHCVALLDLETGSVASAWNAPDGKAITAASANAKWAMVAVDGSTLVVLNLVSGLSTTSKSAASDAKTGLSDQISCLHAAKEPLDFGIVGWWSSGTISIINLASLELIHGESLRQTEDSASVPRDVVLVQLHPPHVAGPSLLVAMEDGNVVTFSVSMKDLAISGRKTVTLGSSPARLHILPQSDGTHSVFAATEHSSLIHSAEGRIIYSATTADDATFVAPFDSTAFPDSIVLATDSHVRLCHIDKERLTHVKALPMLETVRRVAYSPVLKAFGLGCIRKELKNNEEIIMSTFKLVDEIRFQELGEPFVLDASASLELVECVMRAELPDSSGALAERFVVGTSFIGGDKAGQSGDTRGRILVLGVSEDRHVYQIVSHDVKGACHCLGMVGERIVAGLSKTIVVYNYSEDTTVSGSLQRSAAYRMASFPIDLDVAGNMIGVADLMQSLSLVEFIPPADGVGAKLLERARHYESGWATSACHLDEERWLEADAQGNLFVLRRNMEAPTEQDRGRLEVTSELHIGDQINRMRRLHVASSEQAVVHPKAFLGSVEGTLYLFGDIAPQYQDLLMTFQSRLEGFVYAPGGISFDEWRAFRSHVREGEGPYRFVDGEMVERFLDLDEVKQELVCEGLGPSVEDMRNIIEELRRMH